MALADELITANRLAWPNPMADAMDKIRKLQGHPVVVLASGDPFNYGVGTMLAKNFPVSEMLCLPQPSAFSQAAARMGWSLPDTKLITLHGRPLSGLNRHLHKGARILALSWDETTPGKVAQALNERGLAQAEITVLENMGGPKEKLRSCKAGEFNLTDIAPLNTLAIDLSPITNGSNFHPSLSRLTPGLEDSDFDHDGQITKRDIRVITISALAPRPGEFLWDIGLGSGSIAIEWLLCHPSMGAIGFEHNETRAARAMANAAALGTPELKVVTGSAPAILENQPQPDVVFIGGGLTTPNLFETAWKAMPEGGRLVTNAITLESEARLTDLHAQFGGELLKISLSHADRVGRMRGWRAARPVTQWRVIKK